MKKTLLLLATLIATQAEVLEVAWDANPQNQDIDEYRVYHRQGTNDWILAGSTTNTTYSFDLDPGIYDIGVTAKNLWGESEMSSTVDTPAAPTGPANIRLSFKITVDVSVNQVSVMGQSLFPPVMERHDPTRYLFRLPVDR